MLRVGLPAEPPPRLTGLRLVGFASADFGKECFWRVFETFALFYLTQHLGLPPVTAGAVILASLLLEAITDPIKGALMDSRRARGSDRPYFLVVPWLCAASLVVVFSLHVLPGRGVELAFLAMLLFRGLYAFVDIPVNALTARLAVNEVTRSLAWGWKKGLAALAGLLIALLAAVVPSEKPHGLALLVLALAPAACCAYALSWMSVATMAPRRSSADEAARVPAKLSFGPLGHPPVWVLAGVMFVNAVFTPILSKALPFLDAGRGELWLGQALGALSIGNLVAIPVVTAVALQIGRRATLRLLLVSLASACGSLIVAPLGGWGLLALAGVGFGAAGVSTVLWSMTPDLLDHIAPAERGAAQGQILGLCSFAVKAGVGLSALILGGVLQVTGPTTAFPLQAIVAGVSALGGIVSSVLLGRYPLSGR